ncbi:MAG TPA: 50S ribosome-binding GTPase, partial [Candidatus Galloscillospira excrementavium]|nr:50S ribosome-binding GTPase [Candidatus Galloscillospira excrementavium]
MGRMRTSTGAGGADREAAAVRREPGERVIALAGNPNVGKSTVFNALTGLHQHTGNWPGKTVGCAQGRCVHGGQKYVLVDLPGTYSLLAHSAEEELARDFLCFGGADGAVVVCDAACLERGLNLALQTMELIPRTVVCVNLMDEAAKRGVRVDLEALSARLGVPVVGTAAGRGEGLEALLDAAAGVLDRPEPPNPRPVD